jgi:hypothetical protein
MSKYLVFSGGFSWMISAFLVLIGVFYLKDLVPEVIGEHFEIFIGFLGANILAFIIAFKEFNSGSYSLSMDSDSDPLISAIAGLSLAGLINLIVWLYLSETPIIVLTFGVASSFLAFFGIVFVGKFWHSESAI